MLQMMFLQLVLAPRPKTDLPAQHISQTLLLYYKPFKTPMENQGRECAGGDETGKGVGFLHKQKSGSNNDP